MYRAIHLPVLPLRAACVDPLESWAKPLALVAQNSTSLRPVLSHLNPAARRYGIAPGMTTARALARCPELSIKERNPEQEKHMQTEMINCATSLSPDFEVTSLGNVIAAIQGHSWIDSTLHTTLPVHTAIGPTPDLALLNACGGENQKKASLSLLLTLFLPPGPERNDLANTLQSWGLTTIADFTALPRPDLQERLGTQATRIHDIATGRHHRLLILRRPPQDYRQHQELEIPLETLPSLLLLLRRSLLILSARLQSNSRVPETLFLTLSFENGHSHRTQLSIPEPTSAADPLLRIIETHLDGLTAPAPITGFTLDASVIQPVRSQTQLFERSLSDPNQFAHTLGRLAACVGTDFLGVPQAHDSFQPDSFTLLPPQSLFQSRTRDEKPTPRLGTPLRRLRPAIPVQLLCQDTHPKALLDGPYPGPVTDVSGPYRLHGNWWDRGHRWTCIEWDVQFHRGPLGRLRFTKPHHWQIDGYY